MKNGKHGLKALVLGITALLSAMAFASSAQAQSHEVLLQEHAIHNAPGGPLNPNPLIHGAGSQPGQYLINLGPALLATLAGALEGTAVFLIAGRNLEIRCTGMFLNGTKIDTPIDALGEAVFIGCKKFDHTTLQELPQCLFKELETIRLKFLMLPILHGGEPFLLFEPQNVGEPLANITLKAGIGCPLPLNNPLTGSFSALVEQLDAIGQTILFSLGIQLLIGDLLNFGGFPAYLTAKVRLELTGPHAGQKLGIH